MIVSFPDLLKEKTVVTYERSSCFSKKNNQAFFIWVVGPNQKMVSLEAAYCRTAQPKKRMTMLLFFFLVIFVVLKTSGNLIVQ